MKKFFLLVLAWAAASWPAGAETISSVSFNPSRIGEYNYLKIADEATFKGGLSAPAVNISSGGTVALNTYNNLRIYNIPNVNGVSSSAIDMPNTIFHGDVSGTHSSYVSSSTSVPSALLPNVMLYGGLQTYKRDSYIHTLNAVNRLKQKASVLQADTLEITGNDGDGVELYGAELTRGFHLAGNDIPEPTAAHNNTDSDLKKCQLVWEKRKTSDTPVKEVYLLALQNCEGAGSAEGNEEDSQTCSNASYKQNHKSQCCPVAPLTDTICWSRGYKWTSYVFETITAQQSYSSTVTEYQPVSSGQCSGPVAPGTTIAGPSTQFPSVRACVFSHPRATPGGTCSASEENQKCWATIPASKVSNNMSTWYCNSKYSTGSGRCVCDGVAHWWSLECQATYVKNGW